MSAELDTVLPTITFNKEIGSLTVIHPEVAAILLGNEKGMSSVISDINSKGVPMYSYALFSDQKVVYIDALYKPCIAHMKNFQQKGFTNVAIVATNRHILSTTIIPAPANFTR
jgi:hypothetical protein